MDLLDVFDMSKTFEKVMVPGSQTQGHVVTSDKLFSIPSDMKKHVKGRDYARHYQIQEEQEVIQSLQGDQNRQETAASPDLSSMYNVEELTTVGTVPDVNDLSHEELTQVYNSYSFDHHPQNSLPIMAHKETIVSMVETNQVTVIQGVTGCGKTTQVPQFILDSCAECGVHCNIIITQPRRIAAITVTKRVSEERNWPVGTLVGYQVGLNNKTSRDTRLTFCTTGVLLQKFINKRNMNDYTHVILDEVHERDQDMDFTLLIVRKLLRTNSRGVKVILMSATFNVQRFSEYFSFPVLGKLEPAPIIDLDKSQAQKTSFMISIYYLCQMGVLGELPEIREDEPGISRCGYEVAVKLIREFDGLEQRSKKNEKGAVLVFLPGINEIEELYSQLHRTALANNLKWWVRPLHSTITTEEQESVFKLPPAGFRKIILSTNIAESSITLPDIVYVVDFCLTKQLICDPNTNFTSLQVCWASKANCTQRAGRSGRVAEGRVYRLVPQVFYDRVLEDEGVPEVLRCPLDRLILQAKLFDMGEPKALLALTLDPPDLTNLENAILLLKETGALLTECHGLPNIYDGDITFMGHVMAKLPVDIRIAKLILLGHIFSVLEECIIMGAAMSLKSVFSTPFQERLAAYNSKLTWADGSCSDCISFLNAYRVWYSNHENGYFHRSVGGEKSWGKRYFIQLKVMKEVDVLIRDLTLRLRRLGITATAGYGRVIWSDLEKPLVLKVVIAGAFYPNYFVRGVQGGQIDEREAVKVLVGRDPFNTVFFKNMPTNQPGELYAKTIKNYLKDCADEMKVSFDETSKVYVQFGRSHYQEVDERQFHARIPGRVSMAVYRAVKLRQLKIPCILHLLKADLAAQRAEQLGLCTHKEKPLLGERQQELSSSTLNPNLPTVDVSYIQLLISHIVDPGHFWAQNVDASSSQQQVWLFQKLNENSDLLKPLTELPQVGKIYVAPYTEYSRTHYYRARVESVNSRKSKDSVIQVFFIDYGNTEAVKPSDLRNIDDEYIKDRILEVPAQAFECTLSEIQPSLIHNSQGLWTDEALKEFKRVVHGKVFYGKVYSVVHGVVSLELIKQTHSSNQQVNINHWLIEKGYAQRADESYLSKVNHDLRVLQSGMELETRRMYDDLQLHEIGFSKDTYPEPPSQKECRTKVTLRGPNSPLEMKLYNLTQVGMSRMVHIEWNSVNSVLLDTEPQDPHDRLLVAANVGQNPQGDRLTLHHTTLMPNLHGLASLVCLIFAPTIELRVNESRTSLVGALCGLGVDKLTGQPLFRDHDMEVTFDTEITIEDLQEVNRLRYWMNIAMYTDEGEDTPDTGPRDIIKCQNKIKSFLFALLKKKRKPQEICAARRQFQWNQLDPKYLLDPSESRVDDRAVFRLHWGVDLEEQDDSHIKEMMQHVKDLHSKAVSSESMKEVVCKLCQVTLHSTQALRLHLQTAQHKDHEDELAR